MKRAEKIALLTDVLHSTTANAARKRLEQAVADAPIKIFIDDLFYTGPPLTEPLTDTSPVSCRINGQHHTIQLGDAKQFARRFGVRLLVVEPVYPIPTINQP